MRRHPRRHPQRVLHAAIGERLTLPPISLTPPRSPWAPSPGARALLAAISALPRLAASVGMIAADPGAQVEILPGSPTTIAFVAGGRIRGLFILPISENEARTLLHLPPTTRDLICDYQYEDSRQADYQDLELGMELEGADAC